jgi:hypothetical protein
MAKRIPDVRVTPDSATVSQNLGLLADLAGSWRGRGFNLIARPDFQGGAPLYLQLNQTNETLKIDPIGSSIPNRGFGMDDIELFGLTYLDKISDASTDGALHIEPGIWVTNTDPFDLTYPPETPPAGGQIVARMATIPHGNSVLAQGAATAFNGPPVLSTNGQEYAGSVFPSFNSTPGGIPFPPAPPVPTINAAGSSEELTAPALPPPPPPALPPAPFPEYNLAIPDSTTNPRTPFNTSPAEPPLPASIDGVAMQDIVNDPILLLQARIQRQVAEGYTFSGVALNVATQPSVTFLTKPNDPQGATISVPVVNGGGGIENTLFLEGGQPVGAVGPNALTSLVYATLWIETVTHPQQAPFMQLQYAQMTILNFGILGVPPVSRGPGAPPAPVILGWPHISVATLRKSFL